jgi:hypothetical protein
LDLQHVSNIQGKTTHGEKQPMREEAFRVRRKERKVKGWRKGKESIKQRRVSTLIVILPTFT